MNNAKSEIFKKCKILIYLFLKKDSKINYAREVRDAKRILAKFPNILFWENFTEYFNSLTNLSFFLYDDNIRGLQEMYKKFELENHLKSGNIKEPELYNVNFMTIENTGKKRLSLIEFIDSK